MKAGKLFKVIYKDGERVLAKTLEFKYSENGFLVFFNKINVREEYLPISSIVRMEEVKDEISKKN